MAMPIDDILEEEWVASGGRFDHKCDQGSVDDDRWFDDGPGHVCQQYLVGRHLEVVLIVRHPGFELAELAWWGGLPMAIVPYRPPMTTVSFSHEASGLGGLDLDELVEVAAFEVRRLPTRRSKRYPRWELCHEMVPPEDRASPSVLPICAATHLGFVC